MAEQYYYSSHSGSEIDTGVSLAPRKITSDAAQAEINAAIAADPTLYPSQQLFIKTTDYSLWCPQYDTQPYCLKKITSGSSGTTVVGITNETGVTSTAPRFYGLSIDGTVGRVTHVSVDVDNHTLVIV